MASGTLGGGNGELRLNSREADGGLFGLANRPLQPLGHLTASRILSINDIATYANAIVPKIVPEIVPARSQNQAWNGADRTSGALGHESCLPDLPRPGDDLHEAASFARAAEQLGSLRTGVFLFTHS